MNMLLRRGFAVLTVCLTCLLVGCADTPMGGLSLLNPFPVADPTAASYGPTPAEQIDTLRQSARAASKLSAQQQAQDSRELVTQLQNEVDPLIRIEIVRTLAAYPTAAAAYGLKDAVNDNDQNVRIASCQAWAKMGGAEAVNVLAETLASDTEDDVRLAAARALGEFRGSEAAVQALAVVLDDPNPALQFRVMSSMGNVSGRQYGTDVVAWREFSQGGSPTSRNNTSVASRLFGWRQ
jgi:hypothetical protein